MMAYKSFSSTVTFPIPSGLMSKATCPRGAAEELAPDSNDEMLVE